MPRLCLPIPRLSPTPSPSFLKPLGPYEALPRASGPTLLPFPPLPLLWIRTLPVHKAHTSALGVHPIAPGGREDSPALPGRFRPPHPRRWRLTLVLCTLLVTLGWPGAALHAQPAHQFQGTLLVISSKSCAPCKHLAANLASLDENINNSFKIVILHTEEIPNIVNLFNVKGVPTLIFFDKHGKERQRVLGFIDNNDLISRLHSVSTTTIK